MCTFLLLSLLSGILEIGVVLSMYYAGKPAWEILLMGSMYQLGNLLFFPGKLKQPLLRVLGIINLCLGLAGMYWDNPAITAGQVVLSSLCIQAVRARQKGTCPTWLKRMFRIGGFLLAPLMVVYPGEMLFLCAAIPFGAAMGSWKGWDAAEENISGKGLSVTMIFHQMHYFTYTYAMPLVVLGLTRNLYLCAALYALTWVIYLLPGLMAGKRKGYDPRILFFICHLFLAAVMGGLTASFLTGNITIGFLAWMLTGLGGGSVFCIGQLTERDKARNMTLSENIGHFAGALVPVIVSVAAGQKMYAVLTLLSALFVCMALASAAVGIREERRMVKNGNERQ